MSGLRATYLIAVEVEIDDDEDDSSRYRLKHYLDHGTFQDGLSDAGIPVTQVSVMDPTLEELIPLERKKVEDLLAKHRSRDG